MCQFGVFDAFCHQMYRFPPAVAAPTENESQLKSALTAQKNGGIRIVQLNSPECPKMALFAKNSKKWRKMVKKVQKWRKKGLGAAPAVAKRHMACRNVPLTDNVSKNLQKGLQFVGNH